MLESLGQAAREARLQADVSAVRIAAEANVTESTIRRFEAGQRWPKGGPDMIVAVYAQYTGASVVAIWRRAVDLLESRVR